MSSLAAPAFSAGSPQAAISRLTAHSGRAFRWGLGDRNAGAGDQRAGEKRNEAATEHGTLLKHRLTGANLIACSDWAEGLKPLTASQLCVAVNLAAMSALGQKQTFCDAAAMSTLPPLAVLAAADGGSRPGPGDAATLHAYGARHVHRRSRGRCWIVIIRPLLLGTA